MRYVLALVLIFAAALGLAWQRATTVENDLTETVQAALVAADAAGLRVAVDGRHVALAGEVPDQATHERIERAIALLPGVDGLDNQVEIVAPEAAGDGVAEQDCQVRLDEVLATGSIDFPSSSARLDPASSGVLARLAETLVACNGVRVEIGGHTDASGPREGNVRLSLERARAVKRFLTDSGVPPQRLTAVGYGPDRPLVDNATPEGRARNRRIEFEVADS